MSIVGGRPSTGARIEVERPLEGGPPWRYAGQVVTAEGDLAIVATVESDGSVQVELGPGAPDGLAERARLLLRAACKRAAPADPPPPRRIVRWRPAT